MKNIFGFYYIVPENKKELGKLVNYFIDKKYDYEIMEIIRRVHGETPEEVAENFSYTVDSTHDERFDYTRLGFTTIDNTVYVYVADSMVLDAHIKRMTAKEFFNVKEKEVPFWAEELFRKIEKIENRKYTLIRREEKEW